MVIDTKLIKKITESIRRPDGYKIEINGIVPHGDGYVVMFTESTEDRIQYRCSGFDADGHQCFDMIIGQRKEAA